MAGLTATLTFSAATFSGVTLFGAAAMGRVAPMAANAGLTGVCGLAGAGADAGVSAGATLRLGATPIAGAIGCASKALPLARFSMSGAIEIGRCGANAGANNVDAAIGGVANTGVETGDAIAGKTGRAVVGAAVGAAGSIARGSPTSLLGSAAVLPSISSQTMRRGIANFALAHSARLNFSASADVFAGLFAEGACGGTAFTAALPNTNANSSTNPLFNGGSFIIN
jgi:hypothetical protein